MQNAGKLSLWGQSLKEDLCLVQYKQVPLYWLHVHANHLHHTIPSCGHKTFQGILIIWACSTWYVLPPNTNCDLVQQVTALVIWLRCGHYHFHIVVEPAGNMFTGAAVDVQRTSCSTEGSIIKREKYHALRTTALYFSNIVFMFLKNNEVNSGTSAVVTVVAFLPRLQFYRSSNSKKMTIYCM